MVIKEKRLYIFMTKIESKVLLMSNYFILFYIISIALEMRERVIFRD